jgi:hypothetical protein
MKGLAIVFEADGATLSSTASVSGFATIAQNGLVNIATIKGSDALYPKRGTALYSGGVAGKIPTYSLAYHAANFAALDTTSFIRSTDYSTVSYERLKKVSLKPALYEGTRMRLNAFFLGVDGTTIGKDIIS